MGQRVMLATHSLTYSFHTLLMGEIHVGLAKPCGFHSLFGGTHSQSGKTHMTLTQ